MRWLYISDSGLLNLAKADFEASKKLLGTNNDELMVNISAYHVQQSLEKILKHKINMKGIMYPRTYSITKLVDICNKNNIEIPESIIEFSDIISDWATKTRYNFKYKVRVSRLYSIQNIVSKMLQEEIEKLGEDFPLSNRF